MSNTEKRVSPAEEAVHIWNTPCRNFVYAQQLVKELIRLEQQDFGATPDNQTLYTMLYEAGIMQGKREARGHKANKN